MKIFCCVPNVSEGRDAGVLDACQRALEGAGVRVAHRTSDATHHRSVFTFFGPRERALKAALALARVTTQSIDLRLHRGAHPRIGALDVLPFVPFGDATLEDAALLAREAGACIWAELQVPVFFYGAAATSAARKLLANVRAGEFEGLARRSDAPDAGGAFHQSAGAIAVGARPPLVAFNVVLATDDIALARAIARTVRERSGGLRSLRALGIALEGGRVQVSCNLTDPVAVPLYRLTGLVRLLAQRAGVRVERTELIGLVPRAALEAVAAHALDTRGPADRCAVERLMNTTLGQRRITTIDPANGAELATYEEHGAVAIESALQRAADGFRQWRATSFDERAKAIRSLAATLRERKAELATLASREMGKTIVEAEAEVEKCATGCDYYAEHGPAQLADETFSTSAAQSYVAYRPLGVLLAIMPWNFPYWQVFRAAIPALMAGNVVVLKHAANVTGCALEIEKIFQAAGFPSGTFTTLVVPGRDMDAIVADARIAAVTLTGSEAAGSSVAATAGKNLKKTVLELGGSDAFIVLADADIDAAAKTAVKARFQNAGQSCIAAKRFLVEASVHDAFSEAFVKYARELQTGDPLDRATTLAPLARADLRDSLHAQVRSSLEAGAKLATGGKPLAGSGFYYEPTILTNVKPGMAVFDEETFGPVAAVVKVRDADEAVNLANASQYGLGGNLWTADIENAKSLAARLESGAVFINGMTASDPRLPFGGVKKSGYGRELSAFGIREFVNIQTVWIGPARDATTKVTPAE